MRVAIYARYSTDLQRQASIEDQYRTCLVRIERESWTVVAKYKDEAISGAKADRPGYQALLEAAKRREFDVIVCEEVSRLWRNQGEQWTACERLEYWGVHIVGCNDGIDTRQGYGLLLGVRGAINEEYRREIAKRTHRGLQYRVSRSTETTPEAEATATNMCRLKIQAARIIWAALPSLPSSVRLIPNKQSKCGAFSCCSPRVTRLDRSLTNSTS
jgi:DNA invertase Pin-like site-specific DNA recombinase